MSERPDHSTLAASFTTAGDDYDRFRPGFPAAALDLVVRAGDHTALDLGAGTGKLTAPLTARVPAVTAVDPAASMLAVLQRKVPAATALLGSAEAIPVEDGSQDIVTVAQAFHWFDQERAVPEIARVLRPGGTLALLWNLTDPRCDWDVAASQIAHPGSGADRAGADHDQPEPADPLPGFDVVGSHFVAWRELIARSDYVARWNTVSSYLAASIGQRAEMNARLAQVLDRAPETTGRDAFELPGRTIVRVYRRNPAER